MSLQMKPQNDQNDRVSELPIPKCMGRVLRPLPEILTSSACYGREWECGVITGISGLQSSCRSAEVRIGQAGQAGPNALRAPGDVEEPESRFHRLHNGASKDDI
jgi:hypothetical protein